MTLSVRKLFPIFVIIAILVGCQSQTSDQSLKPEVPTTNLYRIENVQIANGASHDATLYPAHFDGDRLNSLGRAKLAGIITGNGHLHIAAPNAPEKQEAIIAYLKDTGYPTDRIHFDDEPAVTFVAAEQLKNLPKTDTSGGADQPPAGYAPPSIGSALQALTK